MMPMKCKLIHLYMVVLIMIPASVRAEWTVASDPGNGSSETLIARTNNENGYMLEIYQDSVKAVRGRFTLSGGLLKLKDKSCPTYQIDRNPPNNRSINEAFCLSGGNWSEYILGYVTNRHITSPALLSIMNGIDIVFRFQLENGDYRETRFSLAGSKRSMLTVFGEDITVSAR